MKAAAMAGKLNPPSLSKRAASKGPQLTTQETDQSSTNQVKSPLKKKQHLSKPQAVLEDIYEITAAGGSREVSKLFSNFASVLSEKAAADTSQMEELDNILREARNFESNLLEKKNHLRQSLARITDKLEG